MDGSETDNSPALFSVHPRGFNKPNLLALQMKGIFLLAAALGLTASANAQFSVSSGGGDLIPAAGSTGGAGGWDGANLDHDLTLAVAPGTASVNVPVAVTCIDSVVLDGLNHTWAGDTLAILRDPNDVGYVIWIRPGLQVGQTCCGSSSDFLGGGSYTFIEPGTSANGEIVPGVDFAPGEWDQTLSSNDPTTPVTWPSPDENIFNTPLNSITGPAGVWTISIYDFAGGDSGSFDDFTLNGNSCGGTGFTTFCDPNNVNSTGASTQLAGSWLTGGGIGSGMSDLHLECTSGVPSHLGYFLVGATGDGPGIQLGNGQFCLGSGPNYRYNVAGTTSNSVGIFNAAGVLENFAGTSSVGPVGFETGFDVPDAVAGTAQVITAGSTWHFQVWHRDTEDGVTTSNLSNGLSVSF